MIAKLSGSLHHLTSKTRDGVILSLSLIIGLLFYVCFWNQLTGISVAVFALLVIATVWALLNSLGRLWPRSVWIIATSIFFLTLMLGLRTSQWLILLNLATSFGLSLLAVWLLRGETVFMSAVRYVALALLPLQWIKPLALTLASTLQPSKNSENPSISPILKGVLISLPVVIILFYLFAQSDAVIAQLFNNLFRIEINAEFVLKWLIILFVAAWFAGALSFIVQSTSAKSALETAEQRILGITESTILLIAVNATFGLYLLLQLAYLFGGEAYLTSNSLTYAEYARKGFFELILVSLIAGVLIFLTRPGILLPNKQPRLQQLGTLLTAQVLVVLLSAMQKLWLYEQAYGFTFLRLFSHAFIILLSLIFLVVMAQIFGRIQSSKVGASIIALSVTTVIALNLLNPDAFIARQNINRYHQTGKIDIYQLTSLSEDAIPSLLPLLNDQDAELSHTMANRLQQRLQRLNYNSSSYDSWQSFNLSRWQSHQLLLKNQSKLEPYRNYFARPKASWQN